MWNVPANAASGATSVVAQARQPAKQHVDLELRALGGFRDALAAAAAGGEEAIQHSRTDPAQHQASSHGLRMLTADPHLAVGSDRDDVGVGAKVRPGIPGRSFELGAHAPHPADRNVPVARAAADHVVQEASVLPQTLVVG